jgi:hypothetical protein
METTKTNYYIPITDRSEYYAGWTLEQLLYILQQEMKGLDGSFPRVSRGFAIFAAEEIIHRLMNGESLVEDEE